MTTVLHVTATSSFGLALWAEQLAATRAGWRVAPDGELRAAVRELLPGLPLPATPSLPDLGIIWPAHGLDPVPSPAMRQFLLAAGNGGPPEGDRLANTRVTALQIQAGLVARLASEDRPPALHLAPDALFWGRVAEDALTLLAGGRFVPRLAAVAGGAAFRWSPLIEYGSELARLGEFERAMPDAARAAVADAAPHTLVTEVLSRLVDGFVRTVAAGRREPAVAPASRQTFRALTRTGPETVLPRDVVEQLGAAGGESALPARVTFRVTPGTADEPWTIEFLLQDRKTPSVLVAADAVWRRERAAVRHFAGLGHDPEELLLRGLARAGRVSPLIGAALDSAAPNAVTCRLDEAYDFLRRDVPHLELLGFGMLLPAWWRRRGSRARLSLRGRVRPTAAKTEAPGELGASSIVEFDWQVALGDAVLTPEELKRLAALNRPLVELRGQWVELDPESLADAVGLLERRLELPLGDAVLLGSPSERLPLLGIEGEGDLGPVLQQLQRHTPIEPVPTPQAFVGQLRPYQRRGLDWLSFLTRFGLGGCLADDMGLGKTVQTIALLLHRREQGETGPTLLLCPTSVVSNWLRELERFAPMLRRQAIVATAQAGQVAQTARQAEVVVSSYAVASRNAASLAAIHWDGVVLDEATNVKNAETLRAQAVRTLRARYRLALTGTPIENRLSELHAILSFANPGFLGSERSFRERFALPIEKWHDQEKAEELQRIVQPFVLRRTKADPEVAADLPRKREAEVVCSLTAEQASLYRATVDDMMDKIAASEGMERRGLVLATITKLKQICNHPASFLGDGSALAGRSGKLARLEEMMAEIAALGERALIFTQFASFGPDLAMHLQETTGIPVPFYHGGLTRRARDQIVDTFQALQGPGALLVSIRAGGFGLNLTSANHVFHYDRWWNPAVEDQATDRAFRFGQTRDVMVYKLITNGTIETHIADMVAAKRQLAGLVVRAGESWLTELSTTELRDILTLDRNLALAA
ncbi:MAG: DEAD/DEAH box helicase [Chloroflexi bacterium]|nr:DEAD/DEAH box helicase [Chloroflexota bacterium]